MDPYLNKHQSLFHRVMDLIYFLVVTNFLAIAGTFVGLGLFGLFPSILTTHTLVKMRLRGESFAIGETFVRIYKSVFFRANRIGTIVLVTWTLLLFSWFFYLEELTSTFHWIGLVAIGLFGLIFFVITMILPITLVFFPKFSIKETFTFSAMLAVGMPMLSMTIVMNVLFFYFIVMVRFISIFPFLAFTLPAYVNMVIANRKIMKLFTVFRDENVTIRTLNSFSFHEQIHRCLEEEDFRSFTLSYDAFAEKIRSGIIEGRLSLVMLDKDEQVKGFLLCSYEHPTIYLEMLWIHPQYRKRGYASKMIDFVTRPMIEGKIEALQVMSTRGFFEAPPRELLTGLTYWRKRGFAVSGDNNLPVVRMQRGGR